VHAKDGDAINALLLPLPRPLPPLRAAVAIPIPTTSDAAAAARCGEGRIWHGDRSEVCRRIRTSIAQQPAAVI